jgi:hypothetical protein
MELLHEARELEHSLYDLDALVVPLVRVRKVQLVGVGSFSDDFSPTDSTAGPRASKGTQIIPKPTFGSASNLAGLGIIGSSPKVHPSEPFFGRSKSTPPRGTPPHPGNTPPGLQHTIPRRSWGNFINPLHMDDEGVGYTSDHDDMSPSFGYEVTIATIDRPGLLKYLTSALSDSHLQLNIKVLITLSVTLPCLLLPPFQNKCPLQTYVVFIMFLLPKIVVKKWSIFNSNM